MASKKSQQIFVSKIYKEPTKLIKKTNNLVKICKIFDYITIQIANKHMNIYNYIPNRVVNKTKQKKKLDKQVLTRICMLMWGKKKKNHTGILKNSLVVSYTVKHILTTLPSNPI